MASIFENPETIGDLTMPRKQDNKTNYKHLGVSITKDFYDEIERQAKREQVSKSEIARTAIREYINNARI